MNKEITSIEYAHIYTNSQIGEEQRLSLDILNDINKKEQNASHTTSLVVLVDDYSFPDPSFDYTAFTSWLGEKGFKPDIILRESQLIPLCDETLKIINDENLRNDLLQYVRAKKYPCSLFIATWYLLRLGCISSPLFQSSLIATKLVNILPASFMPFEEKGIEIIKNTKFSNLASQIENHYFEGRSI